MKNCVFHLPSSFHDGFRLIPAGLEIRAEFFKL